MWWAPFFVRSVQRVVHWSSIVFTSSSVIVTTENDHNLLLLIH